MLALGVGDEELNVKVVGGELRLQETPRRKIRLLQHLFALCQLHDTHPTNHQLLLRLITIGVRRRDAICGDCIAYTVATTRSLSLNARV